MVLGDSNGSASRAKEYPRHSSYLQASGGNPCTVRYFYTVFPPKSPKHAPWKQC